MACCSERVVEALTSGAAVNLSVQMARREPEPLCIGNAAAGRSRAAECCLERGRPAGPRAGGQKRKAAACTMEPRRGLSEDNGVLGDPR